MAPSRRRPLKELLDRGAALFNAGKAREAAAEFSRAVRLGAGPEAGCFLGHSLHASGRPDAAIAAFRAVLRRRPGFAPAAIGLAGVLRASGRSAEAVRALEAARGPQAKSALEQALRERARLETEAGRLDGAEQAWSRLCALRPRDEDARRALLSCRRALARERAARGDHAAAARAARLALALEPASGDLKNELAGALRAEGEALASGGRAEEARERLEASLKLDPGEPRACRALAEVLRARASALDAAGRGAEARRLWSRADALSAQAPQARARRFRELVQAVRYAEAFEEGERLLDRKPTLWDLRAFWAPWDVPRLERDRARHLEAVEALSAGPRPSPWALYYRGFLKGGPSGLEDFARVARFDARRYGWMRGRAGQSCLLLGRHEEAVAHLSAAASARPLDWRFLAFLSQALASSGRERDAFAALARAERAAPREELGEVLLARARLAEETGRPAEAAFAKAWAGLLGASGRAA